MTDAPHPHPRPRRRREKPARADGEEATNAGDL